MVILWGFNTFKKDMLETGPYTCNYCNNATLFKIVRVRKWFTLFFIPIIPLSSKYYHVCPICNQGVLMAKEQAKDAIARAKAQSVPSGNPNIQQ